MEPSELKKCDIVMKGGITSGIVYPALVCKLAERYQFQSIGGTSAGAIAASLTAAAEYARRVGAGDKNPFNEVGKVPGWLGASSGASGESNLFRLFQPLPAMKGLFNFAITFLIKSWPHRVALWVRVFWLEILLGILPAAASIYLSDRSSGWHFIAVVVLGVLVGIGGIAIAVILGLIARAAKLPKHYYGLCTGFEGSPQSNAPSLISWLNERVNAIAGKTSECPLTFGDLNQAGITLRMITTCLTWGRPFTLPFESGELYYSPSEFEQFFPREVVAWMEAHPAEFELHEKVDLGDLKPLPKPDDLPVIVAARLSLSFPLLFCALPLYAVDWTRRRRSPDEAATSDHVPGDAIGPDEVRKPERAWFSDGGICSNFPLHLFDNPLPRWPTFAVNLRELRPDRADSSDRVWMPRTNRSGVAYLWTRLVTQAGLTGTFGFVAALFEAAQNWVDTLQTVVPGYRDRVVHISLDKREGGLNLNMPADLVAALSRYGEEAGERLIQRFIDSEDNGKPTPMTWDNHRWIRYRSTIALVEVFLASFAASMENPDRGDQTFFNLIERGSQDPPSSYRLKISQREYAKKMTDTLNVLGKEMSEGTMQEGAPRPQPALRIRPTY